MKRLAVFVVVLVFAFCTTVLAVEKAAAPVKEEPVKMEPAKQTPEKIAPTKTKGSAAVKSMDKADKSTKALKKGGKDMKELDTKSQTNGAKH